MRNNSMLSKTSLVLLIGFISFLIYIYFTKVYLSDIGGNNKTNYFLYIRYALAILLSVLILFVVVRRIKAYHLLNSLWLFPILVITINYFFGSYNTMKLDFNI